MEYKNKLSICMMVKNEEKYLDKSLKSLKPFSDSFPTEIIVVDTGSEDRTVEIAKKHTDKVYFRKWNNDFGAMRNKTIEYASGEWLLILDGDEVFETPQPLIDFLNSPISNKYNTGSISIRNITTTKKEELYQQKGDILRLFRNTQSFKYSGAIHEQPIFEGPIFFSLAEVAHYGYDSTDPELMEYKFKRNVDLLEKELENEPDNIYTLFQLSQSYGMYGKYKKSLEFIFKAYQLLQKDRNVAKHYLHIYNQLARAYYQNNKYKELEKICLEALKIEDSFIDFYYYIGIAQTVLEKNRNAVKNFEKYLRLLKQAGVKKDARDLVLVRGTLGFSENVYLNLASLHNKLKESTRALKYLNKIPLDNLGEMGIDLLVRIYLDMEKYDDLLLEYEKIIKLAAKDKKLLHVFWNSLENNGEEARKEIVKLFSKGNCDYCLLNRVRLKLDEDKDSIGKDLLDEIKGLNFGNLPVFFGDLLYILLFMQDESIGEILSNVKYSLLQAYIQYIINKYDEGIKDIALVYLNTMARKTNFEEIRLQKELRKALLLNKLVMHNEYKDVFNDYLTDGIYYIKQIYNKEVINKVNIYDVKSDEDIFLIYIYLANEAKKADRLAYIRYLRKGLKVYPAMKKGIELLLEDFVEVREEKPMDNKEREFDALKNKVKESLDGLIKSNRINDAKLVIDEYLKIVPDDMEMLMLKSELYLK